MDATEARTWLAYVYNSRGDLTDDVWCKFKAWCEVNNIHLDDPRYEDLPTGLANCSQEGT
jgi:hypothetical protein